MAPAQSGPSPQSQRGSRWWYPWFVAGYAGRPGSTVNCRHFWGNLPLERECCWCRAFFLGMVEVVRGTCSQDTPSFPQHITRHIKTLFAKRNCFLGRINFPIPKRSFYFNLIQFVGFLSQLLSWLMWAVGVLNHAGSLCLISKVVDAFFVCFGEDKPSNSETPRFLKTFDCGRVLIHLYRWVGETSFCLHFYSLCKIAHRISVN